MNPIIPRKTSHITKREQPTDEYKGSLPKWDRPKILLIDIDETVEILLKHLGYNVSSGSFGKPYKVQKSSSVVPITPFRVNLPNYTEQNIIIINLSSSVSSIGLSEMKQPATDVNDWWTSCATGVIDPRPFIMHQVQDAFDRIYQHGGIFIILSEPRVEQNIFWGHTDYLKSFNNEDGNVSDNWNFLSILNTQNLDITADSGSEIQVADVQSNIAQILSEHTKKAKFTCAFGLNYRLDKNWITLARNKYGQNVAGIISPIEEGYGWIFLLPHLIDLPTFLSNIFKDFLPVLSPSLFPHYEGAKWVQRPEYELPKVIGLKNEINQIQSEAEKKVLLLEKSIEEEHQKYSYLYDLIRESGHPLVRAVKKALEVIGFQSVVDIDEEMEKRGDTKPKREDLQVRDSSPLLLIEVKGITSLPKDAAALQVWKYVAPYMRELSRTDIVGLSIINHQKNIAALDRENVAPFREDILTNAEDQKFGLLTAWDLYRLVRGFQKNGWKHENVKNLFYKSGRIEALPEHYQYIGDIENYWEKVGVVGMRCKDIEIKKNDRIAFELTVDYEEQVVDSLQVENNPVEVATVGALAGIKTHLTKEQAKKGIRVFLVKVIA